MTESGIKDRPGTEPSIARHTNFTAWSVVAMLSVFLVAAAIIGYLGWTSVDSSVPTSGYVAWHWASSSRWSLASV